jgi:hypothetical protein
VAFRAAAAEAKPDPLGYVLAAHKGGGIRAMKHIAAAVGIDHGHRECRLMDRAARLFGGHVPGPLVAAGDDDRPGGRPATAASAALSGVAA